MEVQRLEEPVKHLVAPLPAIERALLHRARVLDGEHHGDPAFRVALAAELRALAEELHYWR